MDITSFLQTIQDAGVIGAVLVVVIYDVFFLQKKILMVIEANTKAMTEMQVLLREPIKCQLQCLKK